MTKQACVLQSVCVLFSVGIAEGRGGGGGWHWVPPFVLLPATLTEKCLFKELSSYRYRTPPLLISCYFKQEVRSLECLLILRRLRCFWQHTFPPPRSILSYNGNKLPIAAEMPTKNPLQIYLSETPKLNSGLTGGGILTTVLPRAEFTVDDYIQTESSTRNALLVSPDPPATTVKLTDHQSCQERHSRLKTSKESYSSQIN